MHDFSFFFFKLCASNDEGSSPWSQVVTYSTLPDKPDPPGKPYLKGRSHSTFFKVTWGRYILFTLFNIIVYLKS